MRPFLVMIISILTLLSESSYASFNMAAKSRTVGPSIHTTYFLTPANAGFDVNAKAYLGKFINGICVYNAIYDMGTEFLQTGDFIDFDAFKIKGIVGTTYNCMSVYYTYRQLVIENFLLVNDGRNYIYTIPPTSEVTIL